MSATEYVYIASLFLVYSVVTVPLDGFSFLSPPTQYVQTLEARLREAAHKNTTLLQENESLRKQLLQLQAEVSLSQ